MSNKRFESRFKEEFGEKAPSEHVHPAMPVDEAELPPGRRLVEIPPLPPAPARPSTVVTRLRSADPEPVTAEPPPLPPRQRAPKPPEVSKPISRIRFCFMSSGLLLGVFISAMALFGATTSMHKIADEFKALISVTWVVLAYILAECCCGLVISYVSDIVGRCNTFCWAAVLFFLASLGAGFSANLVQLVFARAVQGIGGSGLFVAGIASLHELCPRGWHGGVAGTVIGVFGLGCFLGPLLGGLLNQYISWRWMFWMNCPLCLMAVVFVLVGWPPKFQRRRFRNFPWKAFDFTGSSTLICAIFLTVFAFQSVGLSVEANPWSSVIFLGPLAVSILFWLLFFVYEHRVSRDLNVVRANVVSVFPLELLRNRVFASNAATALLLGFPVLMLLFVVPLRCELVSGKTPAVSALMMLPLVASAALGCVAAALANLTCHHALFATTIAGPALAVTGCGLLSTVSGAGDDVKLMGFCVLVGLGAGMSMTSAGMTMGQSVYPGGHGDFFSSPPLTSPTLVPALAILGHLRSLGGCFGVAVFSILLHNQVLALFPFPISPATLAMLQDSKSAIPINLESFMAIGVDGAFHAATIVCTAMAGAALLAALFAFPLPRPPIARPSDEVRRARAARARRERRQRNQRSERNEQEEVEIEAARILVRFEQQEANEAADEEARRARLARRQIRYADEERREGQLTEEQRIAQLRHRMAVRERIESRASAMRGEREDRSWVLDSVYPVETRLEGQ